MVYASPNSSTLRERFTRMLEILRIERRDFASTDDVTQQHVTMWLSRGKVGVAGIARFRELAEQRAIEGFTADWLNQGIGPEPHGSHVEPESVASGTGFSADRVRGYNVRFEYLAGYSKEPGQFVDIPQVLLANMRDLTAPTIRVLVNPTDALRGEIERGDLIFVDTAVDAVDGDAVYVYKLGGMAQVRRFQIRGTGVLRLIGTHSYEDSIELSGSELQGLEIGGRVIGKMGFSKM
jgi:hypothetical protein